MITLGRTVAGGQPRTSRATINGLPLEIFYETILLAAFQDLVEGYYDRLRFLRLVATSWSAVIDNHPKFWTTISSSDCEPVWRMALQRSKAVEIDVDAGSVLRPEYPQTRLIKAIVDHMTRVRSLRILDSDFEYLIANVSTAPRLQSLYLRGELGRDDSIAPPFHPVKWAPNLRDVNLMCSRLIRKEPLWSNLEHLRINTGNSRLDLPLQEIFTILKASPGLRSLDITGNFPPGQRPLPFVKLEALESLKLDTTWKTRGSPAEVLDSIIGSPTARCAVFFDGSDETQVQSTLQSICRIASSIADGEAGRKLELVAHERQSNRLTMGGFDVLLYSQARNTINPVIIFTQIFEELPPSRREAVTTVEIGATASDLVPVVLPIVHSFFPNISHLSVHRITEALETVLGRPNEGWLFPRLETLSFSCHINPRRLMGVVKPRLEAAEAGEHVTHIKTLNIKFIRWSHIDMVEIDALVSNVVVEHPEDYVQSHTGASLYPSSNTN